MVASLRRLPRTPRVVALVGAGVSTSAGLRAFRGPDGLLAEPGVAGALSREALAERPAEFFAAVAKLLLPVADGVSAAPWFAPWELRVSARHQSSR